MFVTRVASWVALVVMAITAPVAATPFTANELKGQAFDLAENYFEQFQHPRTFVLYGAKLSTKDSWTTPAEIKARQPKPWGYGSRIADTALHCGHTLVALLDAHDAAPDPYLRRKAEGLYSALKFIGGICPVEGLVSRGPHPDDASAYYDDSSMDQHTTYIIALARYAHSDLARAEDKEWIKQKLNAIGLRLEKNNFSIKAADGVTESHVGFSWRGFRNNHVSILIPTIYALYVGTSDYGKQLANTFNTEIGSTTDVTIDGDCAYAIGNRTLRVLDVTEPGKPRPIGKIVGHPAETDAPYRICRTAGQVYGVDFAGDTAIVACGTAGVHVLNITPTRFEELGQIETADKATDVCVPRMMYVSLSRLTVRLESLTYLDCGPDALD